MLVMACLWVPLFLFASVSTISECAGNVKDIIPLPEMKLTTPQLIHYWGYPVESHQATTKDGYVLTLFRIPGGKNVGVKRSKHRGVFLLQHALMSSSADWVINLPHQSLGFVLADQGYDVWLGNVRGNRYCKRHTHIKVDSAEFWDFSVDEHASIDFPTMVEFVLKETNRSQLYYVGHSQGTLMSFAGLSQNVQLQSKIKVNFALGPITRMEHVNSAVRFIAGWRSKMKLMWNLFHTHEFFPSERGTGKFCWWFPDICSKMMGVISGWDNTFLNKTRLPIYLAHTPAGTSTKNMLQWLQFVNTKLCSMFDYGYWGNMKHYGYLHPPEYDTTTIHTPTVLISGTMDTLSSVEDAKWTRSHLANVVAHYEILGYNHMDFIWGMNAGDVLYRRISDVIGR